MIAEMPIVLTWIDPEPALGCVYQSYVDLVSDRLGYLLQAVQDESPADYEAVSYALEEASDESFMRVLTAPETTYRLIWRREPVVERARFIASALWAEAARAGEVNVRRCERETWTALGDVGFLPGGSRLENPRLNAALPLDICSPHRLNIHINGAPGGQLGDLVEESAVSEVVSKVNRALDGIARTGPKFAAFVERFNAVLIARVDAQNEALFTSGSNGEYIGRSFVTNAHIAPVGPVDLAESLIHEGIHALLYMQEREHAWVSDEELYDPLAARVVSPWTGAHLGIRPFLQACFVWYGLLHFWAATTGTGAFDNELVRVRMIAAMRGFVGAPLEERIEPFRSGIVPDVIRTIGRLQEHVVQSWRLA
jgi:hypothetical protein